MTNIFKKRKPISSLSSSPLLPSWSSSFKASCGSNEDLDDGRVLTLKRIWDSGHPVSEGHLQEESPNSILYPDVNQHS